MFATFHQVPNQVAEKFQTVTFDLVVYRKFLAFFTFIRIFIVEIVEIEKLKLKLILLEDSVKVLELLVVDSFVGVEKVEILSDGVDEMGQMQDFVLLVSLSLILG